MKKIVQRVMALLCLFALLLCPFQHIHGKGIETEPEKNNPKIFQGDIFEAEFRLDGKWEGGYNATIILRNTSDKTIEDWALLYYSEDEIQNLWNGKQIDNEHSIVMIKNAEWNQDIKPGREVSFGFTAKYEDEIHIPQSYSLSTCRVKVSEKDYKITYKTNSDWNNGYSSTMEIKNLTDETIEDWELQFEFGHPVTNMWNAVIEKQVNKTYQLRNSEYNQNIPAKGVTYFGFNGEPGGVSKSPEGFVLHKYITDIDPELDSDGDGMPNIYELRLGTNSYKKDTDGDGLDDFTELFKVGLDPLKRDTDDNGIEDGDEDSDEDGLANLREIRIGTEPGDSDTDKDGLSDGEEVRKYKTDPLKEDTDGDTLTDGDEITLGFDPLKKDTNDNGICDGEERVQQTLTEEIPADNNNGGAVTGVQVDMKVTGNINNHTEIQNVFGEDILSSELVGLVGVPVSISTEGKFDEATITFSYDVSKLGTTKEEDLAVMWYDEENEDYVIYDEESVVDTRNHTVRYTTTHFSTYMVVDKKTWYDVWRNEINYYKREKPKKNTDIVFAVDISGSMVGPEIRHAKDSMKGIIKAKRGKDRCSIVTFADKANVVQKFSNHSDKLVKSVNAISAEMENKTNVNKGLRKAISQYTGESYKDKGYQRYIILICDGDTEYNKEIVDLAKKNDIAILTVLIGTENEADLKKMSKETGGKFYTVEKTESIADVLFKLKKDTMGELNTKDSDGDGLYDILEKGMLCQNGKIVVTDPGDANSDSNDENDLNDLEEMGGRNSLDEDGLPKRKKKIFVKDTEEWIEARYFVYRSDPTKEDTDNDGYLDKVDKHPKRHDVKLTEIYQKQYIPIVSGISIYYGGDQGWWENTDSKMADKGCGIIAGSDVLLYLKRREDNNTLSKISKSSYIDYVDSVRKHYIKKMPIFDEMTAFNLQSGMNKFFDNYSLKMKAAAYPFAFSSNNRKRLKELIEKSIKNGNPVIISVGPHLWRTVEKKNQAKMYELRKGSLVKFNPVHTLYNHYVVITGIHRDRQMNTLRYQISSWGNKYFVDYNEICKYNDDYGSDCTSDALFVYYK